MKWRDKREMVKMCNLVCDPAGANGLTVGQLVCVDVGYGVGGTHVVLCVMLWVVLFLDCFR